MISQYSIESAISFTMADYETEINDIWIRSKKNLNLSEKFSIFTSFFECYLIHVRKMKNLSIHYHYHYEFDIWIQNFNKIN